MANWLVDKTPLIAIKYDLQREERVGDMYLNILGLTSSNAYFSLLHVVTGWLPDIKKEAGTGAIVRKFSVLMLDPVTVEICKKAAAFQMNQRVYKKLSEVPYDDVSTPAEWVFNVEYIGKQVII